MNTRIEKLFLWTFYLLILFLPVNLGKHFIFSFSYLDGVLVDYWIPTVFVQDLLLLLFIVLAAFIQKNAFKSVLIVVVLFLLLANIIASVNFEVTLLFSVRIFIYLLFGLVLVKTKHLLDFKLVLMFLYIGTVFVSLLALVQWVLQSSVFNNYLFFGEQPYSILEPGILKQEVLNNLVVPPYSLFRHPNVLGGYLSIVLCVFAYYLKGAHKYFILLLGCVVLFLTFSYSAWLSFTLGLFYISISKRQERWSIYIIVFAVFVFGLFGFFNLSSVTSSDMFLRRFNLTASAAQTFSNNLFFGTGLNTSVATSKDLSYLSRELNFFQPTHNITWLVLSEGGLLLFIPSLLLYLYALFSSKLFSRAFTAILLQIAVLGSFDHYLLTVHQTQLLFLLTISFSLNYTLRHEI